MIFFILECVLIIACMLRSVAVSLFAWAVIVILSFYKKENWVDFWIRVLILSLPISYLTIISFTGESKIFKWYNFAILGLNLTILFKMIKEKARVNKITLYVLLLVLFIQLGRNLLSSNYTHLFAELVQEYFTVITVWMFCQYIRMEHRNDTNLGLMCEKWTSLYLDATLASGICVVIQRLVYILTGIIIGFAKIGERRQIFDMTFTGFSVLSVFLGGGMVIAVNNLLHGKQKLLSFIQFIFLAFACVVNSSRSGLIASIAIIILMLFLSLKKRGTAKRTLLFGIPIIGGMVFSLIYLMQTRTSLQTVGLLAANGRLDLIDEAVSIMTSDLFNFLFGVGINGQYTLGISSQHNMFLEMWVLNGTILFIPFVLTVFMILWTTRHRKNRFLLWQLLLAHQFYSSFFATTFVPVVLILTFSSFVDDKFLPVNRFAYKR